MPAATVQVILSEPFPHNCLFSSLTPDDGNLYTFGENENGKLGLQGSKLGDTSRPQPVALPDEHFIAVACGAGHTVAATKTGKVYTFGDGSQGQLGQGTKFLELSEPKMVQQLSHVKITIVSCGDCHTAVISGRSLILTKDSL